MIFCSLTIATTTNFCWSIVTDRNLFVIPRVSIKVFVGIGSTVLLITSIAASKVNEDHRKSLLIIVKTKTKSCVYVVALYSP